MLCDNLRPFLCRVLGWTNEIAVSLAFRSIELAAERGAQLVLCGPGDLVPIAGALHRRMLGELSPFIVCDPRRKATATSVRAPANLTTGVAAFMAARGGSLCVRTSRPPPDYASVASLLRAVDAGVQLIVCADQDSEHDVLLTVPTPIVIPAFSTRAAEVPRIVDEYAADALAVLKVDDPCFADEDRAWLLALGRLSLAEIEKATLRLIAVRASTSVSSAAARLGMAPVSLSRWLARRTCAPGMRSGDRTRTRPPV